MKLKDVTNSKRDIVAIVKSTSPKGTRVKVYERGTLLYIYSFNDESKTLSVSSANGRVTEIDCIYGAKKILNLKPVDIIMRFRPSGVVFIEEKPASYPRVANCYH